MSDLELQIARELLETNDGSATCIWGRMNAMARGIEAHYELSPSDDGMTVVKSGEAARIYASKYVGMLDSLTVKGVDDDFPSQPLGVGAVNCAICLVCPAKAPGRLIGQQLMSKLINHPPHLRLPRVIPEAEFLRSGRHRASRGSASSRQELGKGGPPQTVVRGGTCVNRRG
eukprot:SAG25_NODE_387_length_8678_cov_163.615573_1_plen_172_part_00